ncbi:hypothetical protein [Streptomyces sp. NPDC050121]|uniref:hypothetical protein n=1 Tax=Streptomyces sp. NPDC050121 TaxID=3365601 RepID=UPI0037B42871
MPGAVRLRVLDACLFHGCFPANALLACSFNLVEPSAFSGLAAVNLPADDAQVARLAVRIDNTVRDSVA